MDKKEKVLKAVERIIRIKVRQNNSSKWPHCAGIMHQPARPKTK